MRSVPAVSRARPLGVSAQRTRRPTRSLSMYPWLASLSRACRARSSPRRPAASATRRSSGSTPPRSGAGRAHPAGSTAPTSHWTRPWPDGGDGGHHRVLHLSNGPGGIRRTMNGRAAGPAAGGPGGPGGRRDVAPHLSTGSVAKRQSGPHGATDPVDLGSAAGPLAVIRSGEPHVLRGGRSTPTAPDQPRPTNGIVVAITVMKRTFASGGRPAM